MDIVRGVFGLLVLIGILFVFSGNRKKIDWPTVIKGTLLQIVLALVILKVPLAESVFNGVSSFFVRLLQFSEEGASFLFGKLLDTQSMGFIFVFKVLPTIVFFSAFTSMLYYLNILQKIVFAFAWLMKKTMKLSGAESLAAAANIFIGQTEAPLVVKPYVPKMTRSEIMCLMTGGMATIAGGVFAAYIGILGGENTEMQLLFAKHLLMASIISAPAAIVCAKLLVPETNEVDENLEVPSSDVGSNMLDAVTRGTTEGVQLAINVGAMLMVFIALVALFNYILENWIGSWTGLNTWIADFSEGRYHSFTFQSLMGYLFAPIAWVIGIPREDMLTVGQLLGTKTIINEFVAYFDMGQMKAAGTFVHEKSIIMTTYALCGFANISSIGIQIGGIGILAPNKKKTISELGVLSLIGGTVACLMTAAIAGMVLS